MRFLDGALALMQFGWKVFPLSPGQKIPAISKQAGGRGCLDATDDDSLVLNWADRFPSANVGLACGLPSGLVVIDLDPRNGSDETIAKLTARKQTFPTTVTAKTANGGTHLYYAFEPSLKNSKSVLGPGIDVKTTGGYVVAPPSVLEGRKRYSWVNSPLGEHLPRLPRWVNEALKPKPQPVTVYRQSDAPKDISALIHFVTQSSKGERNNSLFWAACRAAEGGLLMPSAKAAFLDAAVSIGLDRNEALKTIESADKNKKLG